MGGFRRLAGVVIAIMGIASHAGAQTSAEQVALADAVYKERRAKDALDHLLKAIAADASNYEALWKASRSEVDLAEVAPKGTVMDALLAAAQRHAEAAIQLQPSDAEGHFALARVLGRRALSVGSKERLRFSRIIRAEALAALNAHSTHAGALHVLGMWHAEVMRVDGLSRVFARTFMGADIFRLASWDEAQRLLEAAVEHDPNRIVHRLDLAGIYEDRDDKKRALELYTWIADAPLVDPNDDLYKRQAAERLRRL
jgi:tetratricopeptide (TPR) repeat protein